MGRFPETDPMLVFGLVEVDNGHLFNTAVVVHGRTLIGRLLSKSASIGSRAKLRRREHG